MIPRVRVYSPDGQTLRGTLPTVGLQFSVEVGGAGGCRFEARTSDLNSLSAWDSVIVVELLTSTGPDVWTPVAAYAMRGQFRRGRVGKPLVSCSAKSLLEQWAMETVVLPEYAAGNIPRGAGTDRGLGWMMTAYDPTSDPTEPWTGIYESSRSTYPTESLTNGDPWPTGTGAVWVSITGATDATERKLFRSAQTSPLTITTAGPIRVYAASDSPGTLYVGGEPALRIQGGEPGKEPILYEHADLFMAPGDYAVAFDTSSIWNAGGDGVDPFICAICTLDSDADPDTWLLVTNDTDWIACRRDDEPPGDQPPGPTPGALLAALVGEAQDRNASGWAEVTLGFDSDDDSYSTAWPEVVVERYVRVGMDTYWSVMQMLAETLEVDVWMGPDLVLHAAPTQGESTAITLDEADIATMSDLRGDDPGTWVAALALDGWVQATAGTPRREYGMELGTAISIPVATRIVAASLAEAGRWDASARLAPAAPTPLVAFNVGDTLTLDYQDAPTDVRVLSISAEAGDGGLLWDLELVEVTT